jgi:hypothetical protein
MLHRLWWSIHCGCATQETSSFVCSQSRHIAKRLDPVFVTSAASSPFSQIDDVNVSAPDGLLASACMFKNLSS